MFDRHVKIVMNLNPIYKSENPFINLTETSTATLENKNLWNV